MCKNTEWTTRSCWLPYIKMALHDLAPRCISYCLIPHVTFQLLCFPCSPIPQSYSKTKSCVFFLLFVTLAPSTSKLRSPTACKYFWVFGLILAAKSVRKQGFIRLSFKSNVLSAWQQLLQSVINHLDLTQETCNKLMLSSNSWICCVLSKTTRVLELIPAINRRKTSSP